MGPVEDCTWGRLAVDIVAGAQVRIGGVRWDKGLRLGRDRREHAVLVEALAVGASSIGRVLESRAANLASTTVPAGNSSSLARSSCMIWHWLLLRGRLLIWISPVSSRRRRQPVVLRRVWMNGSHVWRSRILRLWWRGIIASIVLWGSGIGLLRGIRIVRLLVGISARAIGIVGGWRILTLTTRICIWGRRVLTPAIGVSLGMAGHWGVYEKKKERGEEQEGA
jgi:hypothetical protein